MKTFLLVLLLAVILFFLYRHTQEFGMPWEPQVVLTHYESVTRYRGSGDQVSVHGEIQNRTNKRIQAEIECVVLPAGMTLTPKGTAAVSLEPQETAPFIVALTARRHVSGAECDVGKWAAEGGLEEDVISVVWRAVARVKQWF